MLPRNGGNGSPRALSERQQHFIFGHFFQLTVGNTVIRTIRLFIAAACLSGITPAHAAEYVIDPTHTYASFEIDHLGFSTQRGQFNRTSGTVEFDTAEKAGRIDITIDVASLDTGFTKRDDILRGDDWFKAKDFPAIIFRSQKLVFTDEKLSAVDGTLVMLGEARPLRLDVTRFKCGFNLVKRQNGCGADVFGVLRRSDFGLNGGLPFIGDDVRLRIQVEAYLP